MDNRWVILTPRQMSMFTLQLVTDFKCDLLQKSLDQLTEFIKFLEWNPLVYRTLWSRPPADHWPVSVSVILFRNKGFKSQASRQGRTTGLQFDELTLHSSNCMEPWRWWAKCWRHCPLNWEIVGLDPNLFIKQATWLGMQSTELTAFWIVQRVHKL